MYLPQEILLPQESREPGRCESGIALVPGAARAAGGTGDALLEIDVQEHQRRVMSGLRAVTDMGLLARLLRLPLVGLVPWKDLSSDDQRILRTALTASLTAPLLGYSACSCSQLQFRWYWSEADPGGAGCELRAFSSRSHSAC